MPSFTTVPSPIVAFNSHFPLRTNSPIIPIYKTRVTAPTLWALPSRSTSEPLLSGDVECLKWQAYMALRGLKGVKVRWDIAPEGSLSGSLPSLHVPHSEALTKGENLKRSEEDGELLAAYSIPAWVDMKLGVDSTAQPLEGYKDQEASTESRAWVSLLEGIVHAALLIAQPPASYWRSILFPQSIPSLTKSLREILSPPPARITGFCSVLPSSGVRINTTSVMSRYKEAISSLSQRLGTDKWFLGSSGPTPLDALAFAYLHSILHSSDNLRFEVSRRENLVAWELEVRRLVNQGFTT